jgi:hypothetical protein
MPCTYRESKHDSSVSVPLYYMIFAVCLSSNATHKLIICKDTYSGGICRLRLVITMHSLCVPSSLTLSHIKVRYDSVVAVRLFSEVRGCGGCGVGGGSPYCSSIPRIT